MIFFQRKVNESGTVYYYIPKTKYKVVELLAKYYPKDIKRLKRLPMKRLLAIYHSTRRGVVAGVTLLILTIISVTPADVMAGNTPPLIQYTVTAYCHCQKCCGKWADGFTANNKKVKVGYGANNQLEFGSRVYLESIGIIEIQDRGGKEFSDPTRIDVYMKSHEEAKKFGRKYLKGYLLP